MQRPKSIKIKAQDVNGKTVRLSLSGWAARIFQHEYDHLQGVLFPDRVLLEHLQREKDQLVVLEEAYRKACPDAKFTSILERLQ
jgi:peptide deformylase